MYVQSVYENSILGPSKIMRFLNQFVSQGFATRPNEFLVEDANENVGLDMAVDQKIIPMSFEVKKAMLEAERKKAETLNMLRLKETLR